MSNGVLVQKKSYKKDWGISSSDNSKIAVQSKKTESSKVFIKTFNDTPEFVSNLNSNRAESKKISFKKKETELIEIEKKIIKTIIISTFIDLFSLIIVVALFISNLGTKNNLFNAPSEINNIAKRILIINTFPYIVLNKFDISPIKMNENIEPAISKAKI